MVQPTRSTTEEKASWGEEGKELNFRYVQFKAPRHPHGDSKGSLDHVTRDVVKKF